MQYARVKLEWIGNDYIRANQKALRNKVLMIAPLIKRNEFYIECTLLLELRFVLKHQKKTWSLS